MCSPRRNYKTCSGGSCASEAWEDASGQSCAGATCDDGNPATQGDTCISNGQCQGQIQDGDASQSACTSLGGIWTETLSGQHKCCGDDTGTWVESAYFCDETAKQLTQCMSGNKCAVKGTYYCDGSNWQSGNGCGIACASGVCDGAGNCDPDPCVGKNSACYTGRSCASGTVSCTFSSSSISCDDGLYCTISDHCDGSGNCVSGGNRNCADSDICTTDTCDEVNDQCLHDAGGKTLKVKYDDSNNKGCCLSGQCWDGTSCVVQGNTAGTNQEYVCSTNGVWEVCNINNVCQSKSLGATYYCSYQTGVYKWTTTDQNGQVCKNDGSKCSGTVCQLPAGACASCTVTCGTGYTCTNTFCVPLSGINPDICGCTSSGQIVCPSQIPAGRDASCVTNRVCLGWNKCDFGNKTLGEVCDTKTCAGWGCRTSDSRLFTYSPCTKTCDGLGHCSDCNCGTVLGVQATRSQYCASDSVNDFTNCQVGRGNCDLNSDNQCETQLNTLTNCGSCGNSCNGGAGALCCSGQCTDKNIDANNCGSCGSSCTAGKKCANGACCTDVGNTCSADGDCCTGYRCISGVCKAGICESNSLGCDTQGRIGKCADDYLAGAQGAGLVCCDRNKGDKLVVKNERFRCLGNYTEEWLGLDCYSDWGINTLGEKRKVRAGPNLGEYGCCPGNQCWSGSSCVSEGATASAGGAVRAVCREGEWVYCGIQLNATRTIEKWCHNITVGNSTWVCGIGWVKETVKKCGDGLCHQGECWSCAKGEKQVQVGQQLEGLMCTPSGFSDTVCKSDIDCADTSDCTTDKCDLQSPDADGFGCVHTKKNCGTECSIGVGKGVCDESGGCVARGQVGETCGCETCAQGLKCSGGICAVQNSCSNGVCDEGECSTCSKDCSLEKCMGNGVCDTAVGENCANTAADCGCGGRKCDIQDKSADIRGCVTSACGDGICLPGECGFCTADCKPENCINGVCDTDIGEKCSNSVDCTCKVEISVQDITELPEGSKTVVPIRVKNTGNSRVKYKINLESELNLNWKSAEIELNPGEEKLEQVEVWTDKSQQRDLLTKSFDYKTLKVSAVIEETGEEVNKQTANISVSKEPMWINMFNNISTLLNWWQFLGAIVGLVFGIRYIMYRFGQPHLVVPHDEKPGGYFVNRYQTAHPATYGQPIPKPVQKMENVGEAEKKFIGQFG